MHPSPLASAYAIPSWSWLSSKYICFEQYNWVSMVPMYEAHPFSWRIQGFWGYSYEHRMFVSVWLAKKLAPRRRDETTTYLLHGAWSFVHWRLTRSLFLEHKTISRPAWPVMRAHITT